MHKPIVYVFAAFLCVYTVCGVHVAITADDGWGEHLQLAQDIESRDAKGTFYINSGRVGKPGRLTLEQLHQIADMGHEIGGHTIFHKKLSTQNYQNQKKAICDDRDQLLEWGFNTTTFCFPYGADTSEAFELLGLCGYNGARDSGGIRTNTSCTSCPKSDNIPPSDPQQIRSVSYRTVMGVDGLKWYVEQADADPKYANGVLVFIFHEYGDYPNKVASILPSEFIEFVDWLVDENIPTVTMDSTINTKLYPNFNEMDNLEPGALGKPNIAFTFDDGTIDHYEVVAPLLEEYDMRGTFFINSGHIGTPGFMDSTQLLDLQSRGHEIGGHSVNQHEHLVGLSQETQQLRIQTDYNTLVGLGLTVNSFAWPYGETSSELMQIVKNVGYQRARDIGGIKVPTSCGLCPSTLQLPLSETSKYAIRSFNVKSYHTFGDLMWQIFRAEDWSTSNPNEKSVLVFTFHTVCNGCGYSLTRFEDLLRWLKPRHKIGTVNELINII